MEEKDLFIKINSICEQSLDPDTYSSWLDIYSDLLSTRKEHKEYLDKKLRNLYDMFYIYSDGTSIDKKTGERFFSEQQSKYNTAKIIDSTLKFSINKCHRNYEEVELMALRKINKRVIIDCENSLREKGELK